MGGNKYRKFQLPDSLAQQLERCLFLAAVANRIDGISSPTAASRRLDCWEQVLATAKHRLAVVLHYALPHELRAYDALEEAGWRCPCCGHSKGVRYEGGRVCCDGCTNP